jgi:hypothetical protein
MSGSLSALHSPPVHTDIAGGKGEDRFPPVYLHVKKLKVLHKMKAHNVVAVGPLTG